MPVSYAPSKEPLTLYVMYNLFHLPFPWLPLSVVLAVQ